MDAPDLLGDDVVETNCVWEQSGRSYRLLLTYALTDELGVEPRAWLRVYSSGGIYCAVYRLPGDVHPRYAGRTPTPADYDAARADPAGVALCLIREGLAQLVDIGRSTAA
ncbi:hypothetical protein [Methylobacterium sp. J-067]|uniref:hypothetical protein n=1 Tax=Methylobacterium sp. J-067 TaxID=2836648 RepID=UPI001FBA188C|nr:hypothetical protein [Methylobacterium sp. J-067]MCJ2025573.1 hypothetical protein [Methylobacterium sp. J-067]